MEELRVGEIVAHFGVAKRHLTPRAQLNAIWPALRREDQFSLRECSAQGRNGHGYLTLTQENNNI